MYELKKVKIKYCANYNTLDITTLEIDSNTVFDIYIKKDDDYVIIIKAGTRLTQKLYAMLEKQTSIYIAKDDEKKQTLNCDSLEFYIKYSKNDFPQNIKFLYSVNYQLFDNYLENKENFFDLNCVNKILETVITLIKENKNYLKEILPLLSAEHTLANHSLHVSIYAVNLGLLLNLDNEDLLQLGTAGLLHDLGLKKIDESITNKQEELTLQEMESIQEHSRYSVDIVKHNHLSNPYIIDAIMHHHENHDGSGYPDHLKGSEISNFASIVSISDVFDALTSDRVYRKKMCTFDALTLMMKDSEMVNKFNEEHIKIFLKSLV